MGICTITMRTFTARTIAILLLVMAVSTVEGAYPIYDNSVNGQTGRLQAANNIWFGDEVVLGNTNTYTHPERMTHFDLQFWATNPGGFTIEGLYANDAIPGADFRNGGIYLYGDNLGLAVDSHPPASEAKFDLYDPPVEGSSYLDYWQNTGSGWDLTTNNVFGVVNFGMRIEAVPEPTSYSLILLAGLAFLGFRRLFTRK